MQCKNEKKILSNIKIIFFFFKQIMPRIDLRWTENRSFYHSANELAIVYNYLNEPRYYNDVLVLIIFLLLLYFIF